MRARRALCFSFMVTSFLRSSSRRARVTRNPQATPGPASRALRERARGRGRRGVPGEAARSRHGSPRDKSEICIIVAPVDWPQHVDKTVWPRLCSSPAPSASRTLREGGLWSRWCASLVRRWCVRVRGRATCRARGPFHRGAGRGDDTTETGTVPPEREGGRVFPACRDAASLKGDCEKPKGIIDRASGEDAGLSPVSIDSGNAGSISPRCTQGGGWRRVRGAPDRAAFPCAILIIGRRERVSGRASVRDASRVPRPAIARNYDDGLAGE